jgi:putative DNA primase/helicase
MAMTNPSKAERKTHLAKLHKLMNWCLKSEAGPRINAMLDLARSEPGIPILPEQLDRDPWLFNCPNGTLDLRTGTLREHRREDLITALCAVLYNPDAHCPQWLGFLDAVFQGDQEVIVFVQRLLGCCLTGDVSENVLPIFWGSGANGKSALVNTVLATMGPDYAMKANADLLMIRRGERHPTELAGLFGKRLVVASETSEGGKLNEALAKDLTGGEPIRARRMREDFWEFVPRLKLVQLTNHKPTVAGTNEGIWRRLRLVPFEVTFWDPADPNVQDRPKTLRQDKRLPAKLLAEREGILAWMVHGCLDWQTGGLTLPGKVRAATQEYRAGEDVLARWLAECCRTGTSDYRCRAGVLYGSYRQWCERAGERPVKQKSFGESLSERGFERERSNGVWYLGIGLLDDGIGEDECEERFE